MKKAVVLSDKMLTRQKLANPFLGKPMQERLVQSKAIDLRDNFIIEELHNGFVKIKPIDENKTY